MSQTEWRKSNNFPQVDSLKAMIDKTISEAITQGLSYEEVYTMLHKTVDVCLYDAEIVHCL